jgi:transcriptional regulator, lysR family
MRALLSDSLKVFITVANTKNFSKAAKVLNLTQPAISFQIQTLEQYYQTMLFDRVNRHVKLTESGELLLEYALSMNDLQAELERKMQQLTGQVKGNLTIGASRTVGEYIMPYIVSAFKKEYPDVDIALEIYNTRQVENNIMNNTIDVGLVESDISNKKLFYQDFLDDELVLIVSSNHRWASEETISLLELKDEPFIIREAGSGSRLVFEQALLDSDFDIENLNIIMEIGNITAIKTIVASGLGVSVVSKWAAEDMVNSGEICILRIKEFTIHRKLSIILNNDFFESEACSKFVRFLGEMRPEDIIKEG